jgi:iron(III) transport system substrate-binding protein
MNWSASAKIKLILAVIFSTVLVAQVHADVESSLREINQKPPEERLKVLIEGARKEAVVYYYGSANVADTQELLKGFAKHYPFLDVRYTRLGGPSLVSKVTAEYRAGVVNADVISVRGTLLPELINAKILSRYESPFLSFLRNGYFDAEGYLAGYYATGYAFIYNVANVKPADVPKSFGDLLNPRWKGRLVMDKEEYDWLAGLIDVMGESKATAFFKTLVGQQALNFKRGHPLITQLVSAGEHDLLIDGYVHNAVQLKAKGAPINFVFTNPTIVKPPSNIGIALRALHPYAAALLVDYHLSKEAQTAMAEGQFYWTARKDVKWATEPGTELRIVSPMRWGAKYNYVTNLFRKISGD